MKKIVLIQGAFDIINYGHIRAFARAKSEGDYLIVALNTDKLLRAYKGRVPVLPYWQKKIIIEAIKYVDLVVAAKNFSPLKLLKKHKVNVYCFTKEWKHTKTEEIAYMKATGGRCVIMPRYKGAIPTSKIKEILLKEAMDSKKSKRKVVDWNLPENRKRLEKNCPMARRIKNLNRN